MLIYPRIEYVHPIEFWSKSATHRKPIGTSGSCLNLSEMPAPMIFVRKQRHARLTSKGKPTFEPMQLLLKVLHKKVLNLYIYIQDIKFTTSLTSQIKTFTPLFLLPVAEKNKHHPTLLMSRHDCDVVRISWPRSMDRILRGNSFSCFSH